MPLSSLLSETWETIYQSAIVKLPRAVPSAVLHYTSPEGPHPFILDLPSRDHGGTHARGLSSRRTIPVYVFVPPLGNLAEAAPPADDPLLRGAAPPSEPRRVALPVLLDLHGGGFFMGSCLEQAPFCALMARTLNCVVVSVDYRMAPLDKFPAAVHDTEDVLHALIDVEAPGAKELEEAIKQRCLAAFKKSSRSRSRSRSNSSRASRDSKPPSRHPSRAPSPVTDTDEPSTLTVADEVSMQKVKTHTAAMPERPPRAPSSPAPPPTAKPPKLGKTKSTDSFRARMKRASKSSDSLRRLNGAQSHKPRSRSPPPAPPVVSLDRTRIALSGFSSGGNLALNAITNVPAGTPHNADAWPCPFPPDFTHPIPTLLYYPAVDLRQLPSERVLPAGMRKSEGWFARLSDNLAPSYCARSQADHWRASPGRAHAQHDMHPAARVQLVLPELDNLADQNEAWAAKVAAQGRGGDLRVERYAGMTHGWTQFPISFLDERQRRARGEIFDKSVAFIREAWFARPEEEK